MKKLIVVCSMLLSLLGIVGYAGATTIDFESFSHGTVISGSGVFTDLVFSSDYNIVAYTKNPGPVFGGLMSARTTTFTHNNPFRADFNILGINQVSVVMGDVNDDIDYMFLKAYNANGILLDDAYYTLEASVNGGAILAVTGAEIAYVIFGSTGQFANSVYFDNFTYSASAVPEPATLLLFGFGLLGLAGIGRKQKK